MDSYTAPVVRISNLKNRFTNIDVIELLKNNKGKSFMITVKAVLYVNNKYWSKKIKSKSSVRKILTEANNEILNDFYFDGGNYRIVKQN